MWDITIDGGFNMVRRNEEKKTKTTIAPGISDDEELNQEATPKESEQGEKTKVTTLSYDEVDPS